MRGGGSIAAGCCCLRWRLETVLSGRARLWCSWSVSCRLFSVRGRKPQFTAGQRWSGKLARYLTGGTQERRVGGRALANRTPPSPALSEGHRGPYRGSSRRRSAERAVRKLPQQVARDHEAEAGDRVRIMPFGTDAATRVGGSPAGAPGLIIQYGRHGRRGKNGSAR